MIDRGKKDKQPTLKWIAIVALGATAAVCGYIATFMEKPPKDPAIEIHHKLDTSDVPLEVTSTDNDIVTIEIESVAPSLSRQHEAALALERESKTFAEEVADQLNGITAPPGRPETTQEF